jgi:nitrite reductase (NO-forming)
MKILFSTLFCISFPFIIHSESPSPTWRGVWGEVKMTHQEDLQKTIQRGKKIYQNHCASCHNSDGKGTPKIFPPLAKSDYLMSDTQRAIKQIYYGLSGKIVVNGITYDGNMPASGLNPQEIADVMTYITNSFGNQTNKVIKVNEVKKILKK